MMPYKLEIGDILLYKPKSKGWMGFFEKAICSITNSPYCHVAILIDNSEKLTTAQSLNKGFIVMDEYGYLSHCLNMGWVDVYRTKEPLNLSQKQAIIDACIEFKGKPYDWLDILDIAVYKFTGKRLSLGNSKALICSEAVSIVFNQAGIDLCPSLDDDMTTPADISKSEVLYRIS